MTSDPSTRHDRDDLFVAEFYPRLGEYLAEQHATGYDATAGRARFLGWLSEHADTDQRGVDEEILADAGPGPGPDPVKDYLRQIGKVPPLRAEAETELAKRIEAARDARQKLARHGRTLSADARLELERIAADGALAKDHLLEANLRLVASLAKRYTDRGLPYLDLIQEGNLGLIQAVQKFDAAKGYKFSTYATWWIRQAITRALADQARTIRIPVHLVEVINQLGRAQRQLRHDLGREPTLDELASELGITPVEVIEAQRYRRQLERPHVPDEDPDRGDDP